MFLIASFPMHAAAGAGVVSGRFIGPKLAA
jgi:hypothetical protein